MTLKITQAACEGTGMTLDATRWAPLPGTGDHHADA